MGFTYAGAPVHSNFIFFGLDIANLLWGTISKKLIEMNAKTPIVQIRTLRKGK